MKIIKELAQLSAWEPKGGDQLRLYKLALEDFDRSSAKEVFEISEKHFNVLYKNLKDQMTYGVLQTSLKHLNKVQRVQFGIRKQYESCMILIQTGKKTSGVPLCRAAIRKAEKHGMYQICLDLSRELRRYYGTVDVDNKLYTHYTEKQKFYRRELDFELDAEDLFFEIGYAIKKGLPVIDFMPRIKELDQIDAKGIRFHYMRYLSLAIIQQVNRDEEAMMYTCHEALIHFQDYQDLPYVVRFSFLYRLIAVYLSNRQYPLAESAINKCLALPPYGRHNWQIIMLHRALLGFHSGKIAIALDTYRKATRLPKKLRTEEIDERWRIVRAYLELYDIDVPGTWRLSRFLNNLPFTSSDKKGQHVTVVILELMHLLKANKLEPYRYRCERLDAYIASHLKGIGHERYVLFMRMLQSVVRGGFKSEEVKKKGAKYLLKMATTNPRIGADVRELEVVPFEVAWGMVLGWLK